MFTIICPHIVHFNHQKSSDWWSQMILILLFRIRQTFTVSKYIAQLTETNIKFNLKIGGNNSRQTVEKIFFMIVLKTSKVWRNLFLTLKKTHFEPPWRVHPDFIGPDYEDENKKLHAMIYAGNLCVYQN